MLKLITVKQDDQVCGKIIEFEGNSFVVNRYGQNKYGEYEKLETVEELDDEEAKDVLTQKTFEARQRRLHKYFRSAQYISEEVIDALERANILQQS